jgi:hypothetical protein
MLSDFLKANLTSQAKFVEYGFGQVEPNHLSAQRTGQIYAQLPADKEITMLEQGQFVKYDYANGRVNFTGEGEWMLVYNEIKLYREHQMDCEFAMIKDNYQARVYSPFGSEGRDGQTRNYSDIIAAPDLYELHYTTDPFHITGPYKEAEMPEGTTMVPRVFKTNVGDIFTTNTINAESVAVGDVLTPGADGILAVGEGAMKWQVVKVYTMPDGQKGAKLMRIA